MSLKPIIQCGFDNDQKTANQMSLVAPNHQSWEISIVCPALFKKGGIELGQTVSLEVESLECSSFVAEWKSWLLCTMETSPYWEVR